MTDPGGRDKATEELRRAFMEARSEGGPSCPDAERLAALALGELQGSERSALADHVVACRRCGDDLRDLLDLHEAAVDQTTVRQHRASTGWRLWAAAALLVAGAALTLTAWKDRLPGGPTPAVERGAAELDAGADPPDGAVLPAAPSSLSCLARTDADAYWVTLFDAESTLLWESARSTRVVTPLPPEVASRLGEGRYFWRCLWLDGIETGQSPLRRFSVSPSGAPSGG